QPSAGVPARSTRRDLGYPARARLPARGIRARPPSRGRDDHAGGDADLLGALRSPRARSGDRAVTAPARRRDLARADRVLPGVWRLRLPLPWPGVPHVNAWAIAAGSGVVLVDTGLYEAGGVAQLERALDQAGLRLDHVRLLVCTHAHSDHSGL